MEQVQNGLLMILQIGDAEAFELLVDEVLGVKEIFIKALDFVLGEDASISFLLSQGFHDFLVYAMEFGLGFQLFGLSLMRLLCKNSHINTFKIRLLFDLLLSLNSLPFKLFSLKGARAHHLKFMILKLLNFKHLGLLIWIVGVLRLFNLDQGSISTNLG